MSFITQGTAAVTQAVKLEVSFLEGRRNPDILKRELWKEKS